MKRKRKRPKFIDDKSLKHSLDDSGEDKLSDPKSDVKINKTKIYNIGNKIEYDHFAIFPIKSIYDLKLFEEEDIFNYL